MQCYGQTILWTIPVSFQGSEAIGLLCLLLASALLVSLVITFSLHIQEFPRPTIPHLLLA